MQEEDLERSDSPFKKKGVILLLIIAAAFSSLVAYIGFQLEAEETFQSERRAR